MKPIYKSIILEKAVLVVSLSLQAEINDGSDVITSDIDASYLDGLRVELVAPNVSGARDLIKSGECTLDGNQLGIVLVTNDWLKGGVYRLQVSATFGTQTMVIYALDVNVPRYDALSNETQEYEDTVTVVSTVGGGCADANVYALDGNSDANITKPLTVNGSVQEGLSTTASGGNSHAEGDSTTASGANSHAEGSSTIASEYASHAEGLGTIASRTCQHVCGQFNVEDTGDLFQFIVGNGGDSQNRHNAFAVTKSGGLALFKADGTPVILDAAKLEALIASVS